jgi:DNA-binding response OmpR family regulator
MIEQPIILVVEDEAGLGELLEYILTQEGYRVIQALNGKIALACIRELRNSEKRLPDLIISDNMMPVMGGLELVRHLQEEALLSQIKFILLSAAITNSNRPAGAGLVSAFIPKPFEIEKLLAGVKQLVSPPKAG